jgi:hypothetical protein
LDAIAGIGTIVFNRPCGSRRRRRGSLASGATTHSVGVHASTVRKEARPMTSRPDGALWLLEDANPGAMLRVAPK